MKRLLNIALVSASALIVQPLYAQDNENIWVTIDPIAAKHYQQTKKQ
nr:hypothetical protein [Ningiella sp. W23]